MRALKKQALKLWGDLRTTGRQETASERRKRKRVEARHRAGNYSAKHWIKLPDDRLTLDEWLDQNEGEALDRVEEYAKQNELDGLRAQVDELRKRENAVPVDELELVEATLPEDDGQCHGTTKAGSRCKKASRHGQGGQFCVLHA